MAGPFREFARRLPILSLLAFGSIGGGCRNVEPSFQNVPASTDARETDWYDGTHVFQVGELVKFTYRAKDGLRIIVEERITEDGKLPLPGVGSVEAAGKTPGSFIAELQKKYPSYFGHPEHPRVYYVDGEVRTPGPKAYVGNTTVSTAVQAAGDFTEAANQRKVKLIRSDDRSEIIVIVDLRKAIHPPNDPPVYPGDKIEVPRKWWY